MDLKEIQSLIKFVAKSGASEVKLEMGDLKITIRTPDYEGKHDPQYIQSFPMTTAMPAPASPMPQVAAAPPVAPKKETAEVESDRYITVKAPIIGTFYRKPSPDKPSFVEVGSTVSKGDVLCVIEAMKLFNEIESEISGKIVKILAEDSSPVEFDQPLFLIDPS